MTMTHRMAALALLAAATLAACTPAPAPPPTPMPPPSAAVLPPARPPAPPAPPPATAVPANWAELPVTEGGWRYDLRLRAATFVDDRGAAQAALTCTAPGRTVRLAIVAAVGGADRVTVATSAGRRDLALRGGHHDLAAGDQLLDQIAFSRGRFAIGPTPMLILPVQAEVGRLIEDCRG